MLLDGDEQLKVSETIRDIVTNNGFTIVDW